MLPKKKSITLAAAAVRHGRQQSNPNPNLIRRRILKK